MSFLTDEAIDILEEYDKAVEMLLKGDDIELEMWFVSDKQREKLRRQKQNRNALSGETVFHRSLFLYLFFFLTFILVGKCYNCGEAGHLAQNCPH